MIETSKALDALVGRTLKHDAVAIDTEFHGEDSYHPRLGLIQIGLGQDDVTLIDPLAVDDLSPLGRLLRDPGVIKVLHDPVQDLTILRRATGASPKNIFDTRSAAGFVGLGARGSLADLLSALLGVTFDKSQTLSDWLQRPLSEKQRSYAKNDVRYLPQARLALIEKARERAHDAWLAEEMETYDKPALYEDADPRRQYLRVDGQGRLTGRQRAVLRELAAWREDAALQWDLPRKHILPNKALVAIAARLPRTRSDLRFIRGCRKDDLEHHGGGVLRAVAQGLSAPQDQYPPRVRKPATDEAHAARMHLALACILGRGLEAAIDPSLVASKAEVSAFVSDYDHADHALTQGWRRSFVGLDLIELLGGRRIVHVDPDSRLPDLR